MAGKKGLRVLVSEEAKGSVTGTIVFSFCLEQDHGKEGCGNVPDTRRGAVIDLFKFSLLPRMEIQVLFHLH